MTKRDMLGDVVRQLVFLPAGLIGIIGDLLEKLSGRNREDWLVALRHFLRKENPRFRFVYRKSPGTDKTLTRIPLDTTLSSHLKEMLIVDEFSLHARDTTVSMTRLQIENCMKPDEVNHSGNERIARLLELPECEPADIGLFMAMWHEEHHKTLEYFFDTFEVVRLNFPGTIFRFDNQGSEWHVPYLYRGKDGYWRWSILFCSSQWDHSNFSLIVRK